MSEHASICVFCGSSPGTDLAFRQAAREVGRLLGERRIDLVYGGGQVGLMGIVADAALQAGGRVIGIIPEVLSSAEIAHHGLTELHVVSGIHERKALMAARSTAFLTLPGGIGTFEEFFEILSWASLGIYHKPIGILNVAGYFDPLFALLEHGISGGFIRRKAIETLRATAEPEALIAELLSFPSQLQASSNIGLDQA